MEDIITDNIIGGDDYVEFIEAGVEPDTLSETLSETVELSFSVDDLPIITDTISSGIIFGFVLSLLPFLIRKAIHAFENIFRA